MTEHEWLVCEDPQRMLRLRRTDCCGCFWRDNGDGTVSLCANYRPCGQCDNGPILPYSPFTDRQLRLFACACMRQLWESLTDDTPCPYCKDADFSNGDLGGPMFGGQEPYASRARAYYRSKCACGGTGRINRSRRAVEVAERFADGKATLVELQHAADLAHPTLPEVLGESDPGRAAIAVVELTRMHNSAALATQANLLREIVGNPYRPLPTEPILPVIARMAQVIYDTRDYDALPMLADRLEDSGYPDGDLLRHLRGEERCSECRGHGFLPFPHGISIRECPTCEGDRWVPLRGPHVRGCWALDHVRGVS